jgi:methionyl-tRNA synthetase
MATSYGSDLNFSTQAMEVMHNSELADILGNLVHRGLSLCLKYCDGMIPDSVHDPEFPMPFDFVELDREIRNDLASSSLNIATFRAMEAVRATNKFLTAAEPWKMKGEFDGPRRIAIVRTTLEAIYICSHYLAPSIPIATGEIFHRLNTLPRPTNLLRSDFYNLTPGTKITLGNILFTKIGEAAEGTSSLPSSSMSSKKGKSEPKKESSEKKEKKTKAVSQTEEAEVDQHDFTKIELRVGQIVNVWNHETADRLSCNLSFLAVVAVFDSPSLLLVDSFVKKLISARMSQEELPLV